MFDHGDRVRWLTTGEDGLPLVRYGFVGSRTGDGRAITVMLDGELRAELVASEQLQTVSMTTLELHFDGDDLLLDPALRLGLVNLWSAEAEAAGLAIDELRPLHDDRRSGDGAWSLAEVGSAGARYIVSARPAVGAGSDICVRAEPLPPFCT